MNDEFLIEWLMGITTYIVNLHHGLKREKPETNAGPRFHADSITWEEEGFSRWMGWRGEEAQEEEICKQRTRGQ